MSFSVAQSEPAGELSRQERDALEEFVKYLREQQEEGIQKNLSKV